MKRPLLALVAVLILASGAYFLFFRGNGEDRASTTTPAAASTAERASADRAPSPLTPQQRDQQIRYDDDPEGSLRLEGQVLDARGDGIGGAVVTLSSNPPRTASSEDDGSFFFDRLIPQTYALTARAGDLAGGPVTRELTESSDPVIIRMRRGGTVAVTVVAAASGEPIAGAEVELRASDHQTETTGSDGVAKFRGVGSGWMVVAARAPGFGTARTPLMMPATGGADLTAELALSPGVMISGRVVSEAGEPVAGAMVVAQPVGEMMPLVDGRRDGAYSGEDGAFRLENVSTGRLQVVASHDEYATGGTEAMDVAGDIDDLEIRLERGGVIAGRVIDASRQPVPFAQILVRPSGSGAGLGWGAGGRGGRSEEDGRFEIEGLPRATLELLAASDEATSEIARVELGDRERVDGLEVVLSVTGKIAGVVVDGDGEVVPEVQVTLMPDWTEGADGSRFGLRSFQSTTTGGGGRFEFKGLDEGAFLLRATRDASNPMVYQLQGTRARTGETDVQLTLLEDGGVRGRVVSERGEAVGAFTVTAGWPPGHPVNDPRGEFELGAIPPGTYDLKVRGADFAEKTVADVVVEPGETRDVGTIEVKVGRTLLGRVLASGGSPVEGAIVVVGRQVVGSGQSITLGDESTDEMMRVRRARTDSSGRFRVRGLADHELVAVAEHPDAGRSRPLTLPAGPTRIERDIRLVPTGSVTGTVTKGGKPLPGVAVMAAPLEARSQVVATQADEQGTFRIERLAAGDYDVSAMLSSGMTASSVSERAQVVGGEETTVDLAVEVGDVTLSVIVQPEPGAKVDAVQLFLFRGDVQPRNGKEVNDAFLGAEGSGTGMVFGKPGKAAEFAEQPPGPRTVCAIPITGDMTDSQFLQRLQEHATHLEVTCAGTDLTASPAKQSLEMVVPEMKPLPAPG